MGGFAQRDGGMYATSMTEEVRKRDGTLCYVDVTWVDCAAGGMASITTWTNAAGDEVALESWDFSSWYISCSATGGGTSKNCGTGYCLNPYNPMVACPPGTCP